MTDVPRLLRATVGTISADFTLNFEDAAELVGFLTQAAGRDLELRHAMFSGRQLGIHVPEDVFEEPGRAADLMPVNLTAFPAPGDLLWQYCPPGVLGPDAIYDLAFCYGPDTRILMPWGFAPASRIGKVAAESMANLAAIAELCYREGFQNVRLEFS